MTWPRGGGPDIPAFKADFSPGTMLFASARPVKSQSVDTFAARMMDLSGTTLQSFDEQVVGSKIVVVGNVAMAAVACRAIENGSDGGLTVEMTLLARDGGEWKIAAQAWDKVKDGQALPNDLQAVSDAV